MNASKGFKEVISAHLEARAVRDPLFAKTLAKPNKSIDECCSYICDTVQKMKVNGLDDSEVFNMAVHYYDEDDLKGSGKFSGSVVVNHVVTLTPEEITKAKQEAIDKVISEEKERMTKKRTVAKPVENPTPKAKMKVVKNEVKPGEQASLF